MLFEKLRGNFDIEVEKEDMKKIISRSLLMAIINMEDLEPQRLDGKYGKIPEKEKAFLKEDVEKIIRIMDDTIKFLG